MPDVYNVPLNLLREHRDEILSHLDEHVVLVCRSGQRATLAALNNTCAVGMLAIALPILVGIS